RSSRYPLLSYVRRSSPARLCTLRETRPWMRLDADFLTSALAFALSAAVRTAPTTSWRRPTLLILWPLPNVLRLRNALSLLRTLRLSCLSSTHREENCGRFPRSLGPANLSLPVHW